jgi:5'-phosphate synthase pdxT subunit
MNIGVLALQGDFAEHLSVIRRLNVPAMPVRLPSELETVDALIMPGGESTTMRKLMDDYKLTAPLTKRAGEGFPIFATCAGMILLAKHVVDSEVAPLGLMDITVRRNAYGRQLDSFETYMPIPQIGKKRFHAVFIRAPVIEKADNGVTILGEIDGSPVAVRQGNLLACSFHPELTDDVRMHKYFVSFIGKK